MYWGSNRQSKTKFCLYLQCSILKKNPSNKRGMRDIEGAIFWIEWDRLQKRTRFPRRLIQLPSSHQVRLL